MAKLLFYEELEVGSEILDLVRHPTARQLVMWAGSSGEYNEIHYDKDFALSHGLPGVVIHGWLTVSFMVQMLEQWMGDGGDIKKLSCSFRGMHFLGEDVICKGKVIKKYIQQNKNLVECEIWAENPKGEKTTPGTALVSLPSKRKI